MQSQGTAPRVIALSTIPTGRRPKLVAPPGTSDAFNKYLELAPDGPHANDVKAMLAAIGAKIETT